MEKMIHSIWHDSVDTKVGFSNSQLERFCDDQYAKLDSKLGYRRIPWFFWTSEVYGIGRGIRKYCGYPWWLPLPIYSDHSICTLGEPEPHEVVNPANIHLTWFGRRKLSLMHKINKKLVKIPFPWLSLMNTKPLNKTRKGTIAFFPHSNEGIELENFVVSDYFQSLKNLPAAYHPLTVCLHTHDVRKGLHKELRRYGLPLVTVGTNASVFFPDRFFDLVDQYEYATSPVGGSELFLSTVAGLKFFLLGKMPKYMSVGHSQHAMGEIKFDHDILAVEVEKSKLELFSDMSFDKIGAQNNFCREILGMDNLSMKPTALKRLLLMEMAKQTPRYILRILQLSLKKAIRSLK